MTNSHTTCDVLLATYNGQQFIGELLDSLLAQNHPDFRLVVRDDGSSDATMAILRDYQPRFGGRMDIAEDATPTGSPMLNFEKLMQRSTADHILFCDQDDVWLPNRVAASVAMLTEAEKAHGADIPVFVFNDLVAVDGKLNPLNESYWAFKKIPPSMAKSLPQCLITSPILGCSAGVNRALVQRALPIHPKAVYHDWWALHVALLFGHVAWSDEKTVLYRLHGNNASAQKRVSLLDYIRYPKPFARVRNGLKKKAQNADALLQTYRADMPDRTRRMFEDFARISQMGFLRRRITLLKWGLVYPDFRRNIAFFLSL